MILRRKSIAIIILVVLFCPFFIISIGDLSSNYINLDFSKLGNSILRNAGTNIETPIGSTTVSMSADNPEGYVFGDNVTYDIEYNFTFWSGSPIPLTTYEFWFPNVQNHSSPDIAGVSPIQEVSILEESSNYADFTISSYSNDPEDDYGNSYDYYEVVMSSSSSQRFNYYFNYNTTLRETSWELDDANVEEYDLLDPSYLNYTGAEPYLEVNDVDLISLVETICAGKTTLLENISAIYDWMTDDSNLEYSVQSIEKTAKEMYTSRTGDCSEFSNLMVTLLRIAGVPARKIVGLTIMDQNDGGNWVFVSDPEVGNAWVYTQKVRNGNSIESTMPGHAWVEYYVPGYGWIQSDPTWGVSGGDYESRIDYSHISWGIGENYGGGIDPALPSPGTELGISPYFMEVLSYCNYDLDIRVEIVDAEIAINNDLWVIVIIVAVVCLVALIAYVLVKNKRPKEEPDYYPTEF